MRSVGRWKVPTLSAREWRSVALGTDGANGSCTWQMSSTSAACSASTARVTSTGTDARREEPKGPSTSPTASTRGAPSAENSSSGRLSAERASRTSSPSEDGATISTRCPRAASSSPARRTKRSTSVPDPTGWGVAWAMVSDGTSSDDAEDGRRCPERLVLRDLGLGLGARGLRRRMPGVGGDELLGLLARLVVGPLVVRRLHEVRRGAVELAGDAVVERQLAQPHGVGDDARRVRRVPDLELGLDRQRHVAEGLALEADVRPLAVGQPRHVVRRPDVDVVGGQLVAHDRRHRVGLGDLLGLQPLALEHVVEVHVAADVELRRAEHLHAAVVEQAGHVAVEDRRADLRLDVVADDRQAGLLEALVPVVLAGDEDGDAVHEAAAGLEDLLDVPLGRLLGADREVGDDDVGVRVLEDLDDVGGLAGRLGDLLLEVLAQAVVRHAAVDGHAEVRRHLRELGRVVGVGPDGLPEVLADLRLVDVEGARELDVVDVVAAEIDVHEAGDFGRRVGVLVEVDALDEGRGAVAHADDRDAHLVVLVARGAVGLSQSWVSRIRGTLVPYPPQRGPAVTPR